MPHSKSKDKYNFALYVPVIKYDKWDLNDGKVHLYFTVKDPVRRFAAWLVKKTPKSHLEFDYLCSKAWCLIDGERNIYEISKEMNKETLGDASDNLRRLVTFIRYISKRGWVSFKEVKTMDK